MLYGILLPLIVFSKSLNRNPVSVAHPSEISGHMNNQPASHSQLTKLLLDAHRNKLGKRGNDDDDERLLLRSLIASRILECTNLSNHLEWNRRDLTNDESGNAESRVELASSRDRLRYVARCLEDVLKKSDGNDGWSYHIITVRLSLSLISILALSTLPALFPSHPPSLPGSLKPLKSKCLNLSLFLKVRRSWRS